MVISQDEIKKGKIVLRKSLLNNIYGIKQILFVEVYFFYNNTKNIIIQGASAVHVFQC